MNYVFFLSMYMYINSYNIFQPILKLNKKHRYRETHKDPSTQGRHLLNRQCHWRILEILHCHWLYRRWRPWVEGSLWASLYKKYYDIVSEISFLRNQSITFQFSFKWNILKIIFLKEEKGVSYRFIGDKVI